MDSLFFLTISVIFISAVIGVYTRRRSLDGCLEDFAGYQVTIELTDGRLIWGRLAVFSSGIQLVYRDSHRDQRGHEETSYVLFPGEFDKIQAIYRYHDELAPGQRENAGWILSAPTTLAFFVAAAEVYAISSTPSEMPSIKVLGSQ